MRTRKHTISAARTQLCTRLGCAAEWWIWQDTSVGTRELVNGHDAQDKEVAVSATAAREVEAPAAVGEEPQAQAAVQVLVAVVVAGSSSCSSSEHGR